MSLSKSLLQIVLLQDRVLYKIGVGYVVKDSIAQNFKALILDWDIMVLLEGSVSECLEQHHFVLELITKNLFDRQ